MLWVVLIIIVILLAIYSRPFRMVAVVLLGLAVLGGIILGVALHISQTSQEKQRELEKSRIPLNQIELVDLQMHGWSRLTGRIRNKSSRFTLFELGLRITVLDCIEGSCETVEQTERDIYASVPPGQARDLDEYVSLRVRRPRGRHEWNYEILYTRGR
jgi:Na+-transporting NADH:ubiquinone oxidoreductase subunit NqrC